MRNRLIMVGALLLAAFPVFAAYDAFLKIDGIAGESKVPGHEGWMELESVSFAGPITQGAGYGSGGGEGKVAVHDISITKRVDKSSPVLMQAALTGKHFQNVTLDVGGQRYLLQDVFLSNVQQVPAAGGDHVPMQHIRLSYMRDLTHESPVGGGLMQKGKIKFSSNATFNGGALFGPPSAVMLRSLHRTGNNSAIIVVCDAAGGPGVAGLQRAALSKQKFSQLTFAVNSSTQQKADTPGTAYKELPAVQFTFADGSVQGSQVNGDGCTQFSLNFTRFSGPVAGYDYIK